MCESVLEFYLWKQKTLVQVVGCLTLCLNFLHGIKMKTTGRSSLLSLQAGEARSPDKR